MIASRTENLLLAEQLGEPRREYVPGEFAIIVDTREQRPWAIPVDVMWNVQALPTGDYSLAEHASRVVVERKSPADYLATVFGDWARFTRELAKLRSFERAFIVVEGDDAAFGGGKHRELLKAAVSKGAVWAQKLAALDPAKAVARVRGSARLIYGEYGIPVFFERGPLAARDFAFGVLKAWHTAERARRPT